MIHMEGPMEELYGQELMSHSRQWQYLLRTRSLPSKGVAHVTTRHVNKSAQHPRPPTYITRFVKIRAS